MTKASIFDAVSEDERLDLTGLVGMQKPRKARPDLDAARAEAEALGFTDRAGGKARVEKPEVTNSSGGDGPRKIEPTEAPLIAPARRVMRSGRTVPINLKATPEFQQRFFALCDRLTESHGRAITQAEGFEMAVAALEREAARAASE